MCCKWVLPDATVNTPGMTSAEYCTALNDKLLGGVGNAVADMQTCAATTCCEMVSQLGAGDSVESVCRSRLAAGAVCEGSCKAKDLDGNVCPAPRVVDESSTTTDVVDDYRRPQLPETAPPAPAPSGPYFGRYASKRPRAGPAVVPRQAPGAPQLPPVVDIVVDDFAKPQLPPSATEQPAQQQAAQVAGQAPQPAPQQAAQVAGQAPQPASGSTTPQVQVIQQVTQQAAQQHEHVHADKDYVMARISRAMAQKAALWDGYQRWASILPYEPDGGIGNGDGNGNGMGNSQVTVPVSVVIDGEKRGEKASEGDRSHTSPRAAGE